MTDIAGNINKVYIANNDSSLLSNVSKGVCIILPGSFTLAGFDSKGQVLVIDHFTKTGMPWEPDYLQAQFQNKSLQNLLNEVTVVFTGYDKQLLVPKSVYSQSEAEQWMHKLHFIESEEVMITTRLRDDKTYMLHTIHSNIKELVENNLAKAKILPLSAYQFHRHPPENLVQCCITDTHVYATCYLGKKLVWHKVFDYATTEDIAYMFGVLFRQHGIGGEQVAIECSVTNNELAVITDSLKAWYPDLKDGETEGEWKGFIYLLQQLYSCA